MARREKFRDEQERGALVMIDSLTRLEQAYTLTPPRSTATNNIVQQSSPQHHRRPPVEIGNRYPPYPNTEDEDRNQTHERSTHFSRRDLSKAPNLFPLLNSPPIVMNTIIIVSPIKSFKGPRLPSSHASSKNRTRKRTLWNEVWKERLDEFLFFHFFSFR